ncbi:MAG: G8 domain-containing protein, partial [Gammaproteobacteria bacterium]
MTLTPVSEGEFLSKRVSLAGTNAGISRTRIPGDSSMRLHHRLIHLPLLAAASFTVGAQAQEAVSSGVWSDSSTWSGGAVPEEGDIVTIGSGLDVVLDVSPPGLDGMNLDGKLSFSDEADLELTTEWILLRGELQIGSPGDPHTS